MISTKKLAYLGAVVLVLFASIVATLVSAPTEFPGGREYSVPDGAGLNALAVDLSEQGIIRSTFIFKVFGVLLGGADTIKAGDYILSRRENTITLVTRFYQGDFRLKAKKVTIPEGLNIKEISQIISTNFPKISGATFERAASGTEGYLFPDTYFFFPNTVAEKIIQEMRRNFDEKISSLGSEISTSTKPISDVIKLASILELEARTDESRKIISGILWKRIELGIPLQVDASFKYINGKTTKNLTLEDLKFDSPYNSYLYKGLPPTPISNPGLASIKAALYPVATQYLYFLTDNQGKMHYAKTFAEHLQNKSLYLK